MKTYNGTIVRHEYYNYIVEAESQAEAEAEMWELYSNEAEPSLDCDNDITDVGEFVTGGSVQ